MLFFDSFIFCHQKQIKDKQNEDSSEKYMFSVRLFLQR